MITVVMTHSDVLDTVKRHLPIWEKIGGENIYLVSPLDSPITSNGYLGDYSEILIGEAEHHGEKSANRIIKIFEYFDNMDFDYLLLNEYDSFALIIDKQILPPEGGITAIKYEQNKPIKFKSKYYLHYPILFSKVAFQKTKEQLYNIQTNDRHYSDRFIGYATEKANIPIKDLKATGLGYSKNTIRQEHYPELRQALKNGAIFFHGVKDEQTLKIINA